MDNANPRLQIIDTDSEVSGIERQHLLPGARSSEADVATPDARTVKQNRLINKINFLNFQERTLLVTLQHRKYGHMVSVPAEPQPCQDDRLECLWAGNNAAIKHLKYYQFKRLMVPDGQKLLLVEADLIQMTEAGINCRLPDTCCEVSSRKINRHACHGIKTEIIQNGSVFEGTLLNFSTVSFRVQLKTNPPQTFQWLNPESTVTALFKAGSETVYSGECHIIKQTCGQKTRDYVLQPLKSEIQRFKHKEFRSTRLQMNPSPDINFIHPLIDKPINLKVFDISGSGFAVEESYQDAVLLPGMVISELELGLANSYRFKCKAQVVYRKTSDDEDGDTKIRCGLALLDMEIQDHVRLVALLQQAENKNSYICNKVDLDSLWDFFFETGFIYPHKYEFIQKNKEQIKSTYEKLYTQNPNIARHFIYQDKGRILGHMAMIRFFENTWLIHHHAARSSVFNRAGIEVLSQIGRFGNDSHRLSSIHMDFLMCYYRPENKFPNRVFGGAVRSIKDVKGCSIDPFAYLHFDKSLHQNESLSPGWELIKTDDDDLIELEDFYEHESGGLMINALNIEPRNAEDQQLQSQFHRLGFKRDKLLYSLKMAGSLKAVIIVNISDIGLNLSDLTNCIKVVILDSEELPKDILLSALGILSAKMELIDIPVLLFPSNYVAQVSLPFEKIYNLWAINLQYTDAYFRYLNRLLRFIKN